MIISELIQDISHGAGVWDLKLNPEVLAQFELYAKTLSTWNKRFNLTSIPEKLWARDHFLDSLSALPIIHELKPQSIIDVGSGAGFPGVVLAICLPEVKVAVLEAKEKKANFLDILRVQLNLKNLSVIHGEAKATSNKLADKFDLATARAVSSLKELVPLLKNFTTPESGRLLAYKADWSSNNFAEQELVEAGLNSENSELIHISLQTSKAETVKRTLVMM